MDDKQPRIPAFSVPDLDLAKMRIDPCADFARPPERVEGDYP